MLDITKDDFIAREIRITKSRIEKIKQKIRNRKSIGIPHDQTLWQLERVRFSMELRLAQMKKGRYAKL